MIKGQKAKGKDKNGRPLKRQLAIFYRPYLRFCDAELSIRENYCDNLTKTMLGTCAILPSPR